MAAVGPVFIVGARLPRKVEASQMTAFSLMMPAGQVVAGGLLTAAAAAGWSFPARFWLGAGFTGLCFLVVAFTSGRPAARLREAMAVRAEEVESKATMGLRAVFLSSFGIFLLVIMLSSVANNGINNQISNILPNVFGIDEATTSGLISIAGLLNIVLFFPAGAWMARRGTFSPLAAGTVARFVAAAGLAAAGALTESPVLLVAALVQILYQSNPFVRLSQPGSGVRYATFPAGAASGWVIAASAVGSFVGSALGGILADKAGFNSINVMAAIAGGVSVLVLIFGLWPAERRRRGSEEESLGPVSPPPSNA
jgi:predicted MFS family arabinose efflux permease